MIKKNSSRKKVPIASQKFELPEAFFNMINEFSGGGYILLIVNSDGEPEAHADMDNGAMALALQSFGKNYFDSLTESVRESISTR